MAVYNQPFYLCWANFNSRIICKGENKSFVLIIKQKYAVNVCSYVWMLCAVCCQLIIMRITLSQCCSLLLLFHFDMCEVNKSSTLTMSSSEVECEYWIAWKSTTAAGRNCELNVYWILFTIFWTVQICNIWTSNGSLLTVYALVPSAFNTLLLSIQ